MSTKEKSLYKTVEISTSKKPRAVVESRAYRGISTANPNNTTSTLYDIALIKQDIINHFHIRQGEKLENPEFGTIIRDVIFEPLTENLKSAIVKNVTEIINFDPRVSVSAIDVVPYESGLQIECELTYLPYNISEKLQFKFDEDNGLS